MTESVAHRDPVEQLAEEFMARLRRGERPAVSEFAAAHPHLADEIRDLFPALVVMEQVKPGWTESHATVPGPDAPPEHLGEYRLLREVARGGMGVVYEAEQVALGRHVALKVLPARDGGDPLRLLRFRREARAAARLHHTNIVPVFDVGCADGVHYYAMQFIQGQGLDEVLRELPRLRAGTKPTDAPAADLTVSLAEGLRTGTFPAAPIVPVPKPAGPRAEPSAILTGPVSHYFRSVAGLGVQAADALAYAHGQRVLHRDVKPSNLLLDRQGTLWLTDFGLAKDDGEDLTRTGDIVGTLRYMAPERFRGVSDPRTDVYALGVTLYELLTLRPAFGEADRVLLVRQITQDDPPRPRAIDPTVPRDLETIVLKAINKEPGRRYPTAAEMADDLRRFLADRPIKARRASWREQGWRWCRRNPGVAASLASAGLFLSLLVLVLAVGYARVTRAKGETEAALADERQSAYVQRVALADRELGANNLARAEQLLSDCPYDRRGWEWHHLNRNRGRLPPPLKMPGAVTGKGALRPDGREAAVGGMYGLVFLVNLDTGAVRKLNAYAADAKECGVAYTPDGRTLVTADEPAAGNGTVKRWDAATLRLLGSWEHPHGGVFPFALSPDGRRIATATSAAGLKDIRVDVWNLESGTHLAEVAGRHAPNPQQLAFSPDGRLLASAGTDDGLVRLADSHTGRVIHEFRHDPRAGYIFWAVAFSMDGRRLAAGYGQEMSRDSGGALIWDVASGEKVGALTGGHQVMGLSFGPGGRVFTSGNDGTVRVWEPGRGQQLLAVQGHHDCVHLLGFTPDGHKLVSSGYDRVVRVWDATPLDGADPPGDELRTFRHHTDGVISAKFRPGGRELASAGSDGTAVRFPLDGGPPTVLTTGQHPTLGFDPTGRLLAVADRKTELRLLDTATGETVRTLALPPPGASVFMPMFSPDAALVVALDQDAVFVWDAKTGHGRHLPGHNFYVYGVAVRPGPRPLLVSIGTAGEVFVWDAATGQRVASFEHPAGTAVAFRRDGRRMATTGWDRMVRLWDTSSDDPKAWAVIDSFPDATGGPNAVTFSPDGTLLAWGGTDSALKVWKLGTRDVATLRGHRHWVWDVDFSPDGRTLATASRDTTVKLWANPFPPGGKP
jgi:WD40 repeat protein/serine/threonine protein kinase